MPADGPSFDDVFRAQWSRVVATLVRSTRDLDLAEDAAQEAFARAVSAWSRDGMPPNPAGWLMTTAWNIVRDHVRRLDLAERKYPLLIIEQEQAGSPEPDIDTDRLRLIYMCCHPALAMESRAALALRLVCGLTTREIARLFLVRETTMAARLTRARQRIADAGIPYRLPAEDDIASRTADILQVIYVLYTEGHTSGEGASLRNGERARYALALARLMHELLSRGADTAGLLALILLTEARQETRLSGDGKAMLLEDMDRSRWDQSAIREGLALTRVALRASDPARPSVYAIQAAIAALHAEAPSFAQTDWPQIVALYDVLLDRTGSSVVGLARAVAIGMAGAPADGLAECDALADNAQMQTYSLYYAARADLHRRAGQAHEARVAYRRAMSLTVNDVLNDYYHLRVTELERLP